MALLHSEKIKLSTPLPPFTLKSVDGKTVSSSALKGKVLVVMFICNHCPYVQAIEDRILDLARAYSKRGVDFVGICSNDPTDYPDDAPSSLLARWKEKNYGFPYLVDETQEVARAFGAVCTPDIFVYDESRELAYHGQLDDSWKDASKVTQQDLRDALESLLKTGAAPALQTPSMGCSIKWKR